MIYTLKINRRLARCQQKFKDSEVTPEIRENPEQYFYLLSKTEIHVFKQLCLQKQKYNIFRISQQTLAKWCRVSREYVNKVLRKFESVGILKMWYHHKSTSHYRLSSFFTNEVIASLSYLWRALPLSFLASISASEATLEKSSQYIKRTQLLITSNQLTREVKRASLFTSLTSSPKNQLISLKKEKTMQAEHVYLPISNQLKSIKLTKWGQIRLSCYSDEAILYADDQLLKTSKQPVNRFKYFCGIADVWHKQHEIPVAWSLMFQLARENVMPNDGPFFDESFIPVKAMVKNPKKGWGTEKQSSGKGTGSFNPGEHNKSLIQEYAPHLLQQPKKKQTWQEELEELKITDPKRYEWRIKYQQDLLLACGRDPITGNALPDFDQEKAARVLSNLF